jgi:uncharacterized SAM-binding protein YcdF (DUF218 family)
VDALIVLGPGRNGERIEKALELMRSGASNVLVVSEGNGAAWRRVADVCTRPTSFQIVCFRATPYTTRGEAQIASRLATARGWGEIAVVTSTYHITRARMLWRRCYDGELRMISAGRGGNPGEWIASVLHEWGGLAEALLQREC